MQNLLGYGGESYVSKGVISHYVGKARLSWVDCEDVAAVAAEALLKPERHGGQTYRLGYEALTYDDIAAIFTRVLGQPFSYEPHPPEEFYRNVLAAGAEPAYMEMCFRQLQRFHQGHGRKVRRGFWQFFRHHRTKSTAYGRLCPNPCLKVPLLINARIFHERN